MRSFRDRAVINERKTGKTQNELPRGANEYVYDKNYTAMQYV